MSLIIGIFISMVGMIYFMYGKKMTDFSFLIIGILMMAFPYFVGNILLTIFLSIALLVAPFIMKRIL